MRSADRIRGILGFLLVVSGTAVACAHDLTASTCTLHLKPDRLELQIKIAAESIWPQVQDTTAPGALFVLEDFEKVGKPILIAFARTMQQLSAGGKFFEPQRADVAVVEDNFVFSFAYPRPPPGPARLTESYLKRMPSDYISRVMWLDDHDEGIAVKILSGSDTLFELNVPAAVEVKTRTPRATSAPAGLPSRPVTGLQD